MVAANSVTAAPLPALRPFEVAERPGCRFALRFGVADDGDTPSVARLADYACLELREELEAADRGLPVCRPREVTWLDV
jgi:hypothetical protein